MNLIQPQNGKECKKCGLFKPLFEFRPHPTCPTGRGACRKCASEYTKQWRMAHLDYRNLWEWKHYQTNPARRAWRLEYSKRWNKRFPEKASARRIVNNAIKSGKLRPLGCEVCGRYKTVQAHHDDYAKPLEVRWLCAKHHVQHHRSQIKSQLL